MLLGNVFAMGLSNSMGTSVNGEILEGIDQLKKFEIMLASDNTWQGVIGDSWPYSDYPPMFNWNIKPGEWSMSVINIKQNVWTHLNGVDNLETCMSENRYKGCGSIFDPISITQNLRHVISISYDFKE